MIVDVSYFSCIEYIVIINYMFVKSFCFLKIKNHRIRHNVEKNAKKTFDYFR